MLTPQQKPITASFFAPLARSHAAAFLGWAID
jgi:hypothetical protein